MINLSVMVIGLLESFLFSIVEIHYRKTEKFINIQDSGIMFGVCAGTELILIFEVVF